MSSDPADLNPNPQPQASPGPSPTASPSPFANTPATTAVAPGGGTQSTPAVDPTSPPAQFVQWVNTVLQGRLGITKYGLIPSSVKKALIDKLWQDPTIQQDYTTNYSNFTSSNAEVALSATAQMQNLIQSTMYGQGSDPTIAVDYANMLTAAGVQMTAAEQAALSGATQAINAPVPKPFYESKVSGYDYGAQMPPGGWSSKAPGESFGWKNHMGIDYGTQAGERIVSPFAGTVHVVTGAPGYGNIVYVQLDNGWVMGFGHVASGAVTNGARVNPGDLIALAGQNVGSSVGSVTIVTWQAPGGIWGKNGEYSGSYQNPHEVLDPIFSGATFSSLGAPGAAGTGMPSVNKVLDAEYPTIKSDWLTYFGTPPSPEDVYNVINHGTTPQQWSDYIRSLDSHIGGLNIGQYYDLRQTADAVSGKVLGHPSTDSIVAELSQQGIVNPNAVTNWYNMHGETGVPKEDYQKIYKATQHTYDNVFNESQGADPRHIREIYDGQHAGLQTE